MLDIVYRGTASSRRHAAYRRADEPPPRSSKDCAVESSFELATASTYPLIDYALFLARMLTELTVKILPKS